MWIIKGARPRVGLLVAWSSFSGLLPASAGGWPALVCRRAGFLCVCGCVVLWFANWRVDASKNFLFLVSISSSGRRAWCLVVVVDRFSLLGHFCVDCCPGFCSLLTGWVFACLGAQWWMPWRMGLMKDVWGRDRPGGAADRALIPGFPNGVTRQLLAVTRRFGGEVRREVKHLSTCRKRHQTRWRK